MNYTVGLNMVGSYRFDGQQKDGSELPVAVKEGIQSDSGIHPASTQWYQVAFPPVLLQRLMLSALKSVFSTTMAFR